MIAELIQIPLPKIVCTVRRFQSTANGCDAISRRIKPTKIFYRFITIIFVRCNVLDHLLASPHGTHPPPLAWFSQRHLCGASKPIRHRTFHSPRDAREGLERPPERKMATAEPRPLFSQISPKEGRVSFPVWARRCFRRNPQPQLHPRL